MLPIAMKELGDYVLAFSRNQAPRHVVDALRPHGDWKDPTTVAYEPSSRASFREPSGRGLPGSLGGGAERKENPYVRASPKVHGLSAR